MAGCYLPNVRETGPELLDVLVGGPEAEPETEPTDAPEEPASEPEETEE